MKCPFKNLKTPFCKAAKSEDKCPEKSNHPHLHSIKKHLKGFKKG